MQELHDDVEELVRMVDDQVLLPDRGEAVAAMVADALRESADCRARIRDRAGRGATSCDSSLSASTPSTMNTLVVGGAERALHESAAVRAASTRFDFEPDHRSAAAALERRLEQPHQVLGLFLDFQVASRG